MQSVSNNPGINRGLLYLKEGIAANRWRSDEYLPGLAALAGSAGVSRNTMWKAARLAAAQGLIVVIPRGRIFCANRPEKPAERQSQLWLQTRKKISEDLINGAFRQKSELPSPKELSIRYRVSCATMRKILHSLVRQNLIQRSGRAFRMPGRIPLRSPSDIVVISGSLSSIASDVARERMKGVTDALEKECKRAGLHLRNITLASDQINACSRSIRSLITDNSMAGAIYNLWLSESGAWRDRVLGFVRALSNTGKPIAVLDHAGNFPLVTNALSHTNMRIFRVGSRMAGSAIARHLIDLGHRSFAFISLFPSSSWSKERLQGIQEMCANAGLTGAVDVFGKDFYRDFPLPQGTTLEQNLVRRTFSAARAEQELQELVRQYKAIQGTSVSTGKPWAKEIDQTLLDLSTTHKLIHKSISADAYGALIAALADRVMSQLVHAYAEELFFDVEQTSRATAWICSGDGTAARALRYLATTGKKVPRDISIASFDNTMRAYEQELTSVDFNMDNAAYVMLRFILEPGNKKFIENRPLIEIDPGVIVRSTTGKALQGG